MQKIVYLSHPEVKIDPQTPVPEWELSEQGRARLDAAVARGWPGRGWRIIASPETKAQQAAEILARAFALPLHTHPDMGEVDRSSTGYIPHARHEALADALFARPDLGPEGWESANAATTRIARCLTEVLAEVRDDLLFVGHGAVGTFLWCHLTGQPIARRQDQPRQGCLWSLTLKGGAVTDAALWRPLEHLP